MSAESARELARQAHGKLRDAEKLAGEARALLRQVISEMDQDHVREARERDQESRTVFVELGLDGARKILCADHQELDPSRMVAVAHSPRFSLTHLDGTTCDH